MSDEKPEEAKRVPVDFRYDAINPAFLKRMAQLAGYAAQKYGSWEQYRTTRLTGEKSPFNHIFEHLRQYQAQERYDHFDGDPKWHLVAVAYNAMMEFYYHAKFGPEVHPLHIEPVPTRTVVCSKKCCACMGVAVPGCRCECHDVGDPGWQPMPKPKRPNEP